MAKRMTKEESNHLFGVGKKFSVKKSTIKAPKVKK
jgi:hypothetical protein